MDHHFSKTKGRKQGQGVMIVDCGWYRLSKKSIQAEALMTFSLIIFNNIQRHILAIEKPQRFYTKHIEGSKDLSYKERLSALNIYSLEHRRERYLIIYILGKFWKILLYEKEVFIL